MEKKQAQLIKKLKSEVSSLRSELREATKILAKFWVCVEPRNNVKWRDRRARFLHKHES